jgi:hypothetical protein
MKNLFSINFRLNRPKGYTGKGDKYLPKIIQDLAGLLRKTQKEFKYQTLRRPADKIRELAEVLVEFAEDVHNDIGIWRGLKQYNYEFFGTMLPMTLQPSKDTGLNNIDRYRIQHLLWVQYSLCDPQLILSPLHQDLCLIAEVVSDFLGDRFEKRPFLRSYLNRVTEFAFTLTRMKAKKSCRNFMILLADSKKASI